MTTKLKQCPCCDYFTLSLEEDYEICPVCFWEQDYFDIELPDEESGANHGLTIREARKNFLILGACSSDMVKHVLPLQKRNAFVVSANPSTP